MAKTFHQVPSATTASVASNFTIFSEASLLGDMRDQIAPHLAEHNLLDCCCDCPALAASHPG
jgi:hypothetical protein